MCLYLHRRQSRKTKEGRNWKRSRGGRSWRKKKQREKKKNEREGDNLPLSILMLVSAVVLLDPFRGIGARGEIRQLDHSQLRTRDQRYVPERIRCGAINFSPLHRPPPPPQRGGGKGGQKSPGGPSPRVAPPPPPHNRLVSTVDHIIGKFI